MHNYIIFIIHVIPSRLINLQSSEWRHPIKPVVVYSSVQPIYDSQIHYYLFTIPGQIIKKKIAAFLKHSKHT